MDFIAAWIHFLAGPVFVLANVLTALRLLFFQRAGARFRRGMAVVAYVLFVCTGGEVIDVITRGFPVSVWQAGIAVVLAVLVWRARGNVAAMVEVRP